MDSYATRKTRRIRDGLAKRPRGQVQVTPSGASWINQVERFFAPNHRQTDKARGPQLGPDACGRHPHLHPNPQHRSKASPVDQIRRRHPRINRAILPPKYQTRGNFGLGTAAGFGLLLTDPRDQAVE
jgi:hypothetical protein